MVEILVAQLNAFSPETAGRAVPPRDTPTSRARVLTSARASTADPKLCS